jgi:hypothetical protein
MARFAALAGTIAAFAALPTAQAAEQLVTGTVAPTVSVSIDGSSAAGGTTVVTVTREQRGDTLYVTVTPAG